MNESTYPTDRGSVKEPLSSITLPTAVGAIGRTYTIKRTGSSNVIIDGDGSQTIDGETTYILTAQYKYVKVVSDGTNWIIIGNN